MLLISVTSAKLKLKLTDAGSSTKMNAMVAIRSSTCYLPKDGKIKSLIEALLLLNLFLIFCYFSL